MMDKIEKWQKIINMHKDEIRDEIRQSLASSTGCPISEYDQEREDVLYITESGKLYWYCRTNNSEIPRIVHAGNAEIIFTHNSYALGCYGCTDEYCSEFDEKPQYSQAEIDVAIKELAKDGGGYKI